MQERLISFAPCSTTPDLRLDESTEFANKEAHGSVDLIEGDVDVTLEVNCYADGDGEIYTWIGFWACDTTTQENWYLFEANMYWLAEEGYPTHAQKYRAETEAYSYFAPLINEQLDQMQSDLDS